MTSQKTSFSKGLEGVIADETSICTVSKEGHGLMYRGYTINDLSENCIFEEVAYLLTRGNLPNKEELNEYCNKINNLFELPYIICKMLEIIPKQSHPMDVLRTTASLLGSIYIEHDINNKQETLNIGDRLLAIFPSAIAYHYRFHFHNEIISTKGIKGDRIAKHFLRLLHNKEPKNKNMIRCMDVSLICYGEHGFAASTFACRVTTSTLSDAYSCIVSAIGTLRGPLHGGANEAAFELISKFKNENDAKTQIYQMLKNKEKIMGFGHRIYKKLDPRSSIMQKWAETLQDGPYGTPNYIKVAAVIQKIMWEEKKLFPNVDYPAALAYHQCGIPTNLFTPIFVMARTAGWISHIIEQRQNNRLVRPSALYIGPSLQKFIPIQQRNNNNNNNNKVQSKL